MVTQRFGFKFQSVCKLLEISFVPEVNFNLLFLKMGREERRGWLPHALVAAEGGVGVISQALLPHCSSSGRRWGGRSQPSIAATLL